MKDKALKLALDWYDSGHEDREEFQAMIENLLATPTQEPVAWQIHPFDYGIGHKGVYARTDRLEQVEIWKRKGWTVQPLYTHPSPAAQRPWVGLTDEQRNDCIKFPQRNLLARDGTTSQRIARAIEAKLKELNA